MTNAEIRRQLSTGMQGETLQERDIVIERSGIYAPQPAARKAPLTAWEQIVAQMGEADADTPHEMVGILDKLEAQGII